MEASFNLSYSAFERNSGIYRYKGMSLGNFVLNSGVRKFRHGKSIVEISTKLDKGGHPEHDKLDGRRSAKLAIRATVDH